MATDAVNSLEQSTSRIRTHEPIIDPGVRATRRVAEYLHALGIADMVRVDQLAEEIVAANSHGGEPRAEVAIAAAQERVELFLHGVFGDDASQIEPLWLRAFLSAHPEHFLGNIEAARTAVESFGDPRAGKAPAHNQFRDQQLRRMRAPRWALGLIPPAAITFGATFALVHALAENGLSAAELVWALLFAFLFGLASIGLLTASVGFVTGLLKRRAPASVATQLPRSALVMPIYHENPEHVFAALIAMRESLTKTPGGDAFEIFVLSDSRDPEKAAEEERAFRRAASSGDTTIPMYYRRRAKNERQKAGNLAEFFERWGHRYTYAVILDADSLMRGETIVELVRRMEAQPKVALLQAPLELHRGTTLFSRAQQLAGSVSGPMFTRGLATWADGTANYYGHNAAVRVNAFLECCALPVLAGQPPLGGHILSHDFVEAALLCRAGWEVRIAHDLSGSWEELPPTLPEYVGRDRRWCQGNMQHLQIAISEGLKPMSRIHMLVGAFAYLAGPVWMLFVIIGAILAATSATTMVPPKVAVILAGATAITLLGPRLLGLLSTLFDRDARRAHGGAIRVVLSVLFEAIFAATIAPLLMVHHTKIVLSILMGGSISWGAQSRRSTGALMKIVRSELTSTVLGVVMVALLVLFALPLVPWLSPIWLPLVLAIPLALLASSEWAGQALAFFGILRVPSETSTDDLVLRADDLRSMTTADDSARFRDMVLDPVLLAAHIARLPKDPPTANAPAKNGEQLERAREKARRAGPTALSVAERKLLASDAESMRWLHREAWRHWPVESWQLAREQPQLPPEPTRA
ncbi:MAG: glycosyl transferase family 2 [Myxococcaceae bacterium]|nr:glycosyl transferase family 2 [Myxococcaceae bacterium]